MSVPKKVIVILGGGLVKNPDGTFRTTTFDDVGDHNGILGDRLRVEAAYYLYQDDPERIIIASAGQGIFNDLGEHPDIAAVIKKEVMQLGVPENKIIEENSSNTTWQQLVNLKKILQTKNVAETLIVTNQWHLPRIQAMIENNQDLGDFYQLINCQLIDAEKTVLKADPDKWRKNIHAAYQSQAMQERLELENQGLEQIKQGTYNYQ